MFYLRRVVKIMSEIKREVIYVYQDEEQRWQCEITIGNLSCYGYDVDKGKAYQQALGRFNPEVLGGNEDDEKNDR